MSSTALVVAEKVASMFLMAAAGFFCARTKMVSRRGAQQMTSLLLYVVTPCLIVSSLQGVIGQVTWQQLASAGGFAVLAFVASILLSLLMFRKHPQERKNILRFAVVYSNCGFMGLPLVQSVLGKEGVAYTSVFLVVFYIFVWTHGIGIMRGKAGDWRKAVFNPGTIGIVIALPLFLFSIHLPGPIFTAVDSLGFLNTPLAMLVIGHSFAGVDKKDFTTGSYMYGAVLGRLVVVPLLFCGIASLFHPSPAVLTSCMLLCAAPVAGNTTMFSVMLGQDDKLASRMVAVSSLLSVITMPAFAALATYVSSR